MRPMKAILFAGLLFLASCASIITPTSFNQRVAYAEGLAAAIGKTCLNLSQRSRIPLSTMIRCTSVVEQAGTMIDTARTVGGASGEERLAAAQRLLTDLEEDIRKREAP